jgi:hypothetical protein
MIADTRKSWGWSTNRRSVRRRLVILYWVAAALLVAAVVSFGVRHNGVFDTPLIIFFPVLLPGLLAACG